jgi:hypothetical protein
MTTALRNGRTREQAMQALSKGNEVRVANSITIMAIRQLRSKDAGLRAAAKILREADMDGPLGAMPVYRLTFAAHYVAERAGLQLLAAAHIFADRPLRRLTQRQRDALADAMCAAAARTEKRRR